MESLTRSGLLPQARLKPLDQMNTTEASDAAADHTPRCGHRASSEWIGHQISQDQKNQPTHSEKK